MELITYNKNNNIYPNRINILYIEYIIKVLSKFINKIWIYKEDITLSIKYGKDNNNFLNIFKFFKNHFFFFYKQLVDLTAIDYLSNNHRFSLFYNLLNIHKNKRIFIKYDILFTSDKFINYVSSLGNLYSSSLWLEREVWDMYGIIFFGNSDLRRILTDYGFKGHPLRKDFPLVGFLELTFDVLTKTLRYVPVELSQDYRKFQFINSWDNI
jgi:NADH:ubiquinone oxidoreductase subunit C